MNGDTLYVVSIEKHVKTNAFHPSRPPFRVVSRIDDEEEPMCLQCQILFKERRNRLTRETSMMIDPRLFKLLFHSAFSCQF